MNAIIVVWWHLPALLRRVHLSWWGTFAMVLVVDRDWMTAVAVAAGAATITGGLLYAFDRDPPVP